MAPLKSGHKIIVALHTPSDVPLLMNALSLPNDLMVSEYITPPQPVKLMLNGVSNPLLGPPNIVQTIFASNEKALHSMNHSDLIYVNHSKCRKQSSLGHNKFNVSFLASPKFIRVLSNLDSCVYIGNEKHNMSDFTTNFFCRNCCSLEHLSNFCQATPKCAKCAKNHHESECEITEKYCANCDESGHSANEFEKCQTYMNALYRRYANLNWLDQHKHEKYVTNNGISRTNPNYMGDSVSFDGQPISADLPPDIVQSMNEWK